VCLKIQHYLFRSIGIIVLILVCAIRIGFGQNYWVQVVNKTGYYIHVMVNDRSYLYIKPEGHFKDNFDTYDIKIKVFYAPGQNISAEISRQYWGKTDSDIICEKGIFCNEEPELSVNWFVTPEDFMGSDALNIPQEN